MIRHSCKFNWLPTRLCHLFLNSDSFGTPLMESVDSCRVLVFSFRLGYASKKFLFYIKILHFDGIFKTTFNDDHNLIQLIETLNIF